MSAPKISRKFLNLSKALKRLNEAVKVPRRNKLAVDGTIQRFEFAFELFWKTLKVLLEAEGLDAQTPRESLQRSFQAGWIFDETLWLQMLKDRNETSHLYDESLAKRIHKRIKTYAIEMESVFDRLKSR